MNPLDALHFYVENFNGPFIWTPEHELHFDNIKNISCSELALSHADPSQPS